jgi:hypothetical protein
VPVMDGGVLRLRVDGLLLPVLFTLIATTEAL